MTDNFIVQAPASCPAAHSILTIGNDVNVYTSSILFDEEANPPGKIIFDNFNASLFSYPGRLRN
ncbi:MAG TPA: hypothetical protein VFD75_11990 [Pyrinomonadaceae bacterium]|nr:hypothetical protein [Pyrinomonadaceae bacterium]